MLAAGLRAGMAAAASGMTRPGGWTGSLAVRSSGGEPSQSQLRWNLMGEEVNAIGRKKNYFL